MAAEERFFHNKRLPFAEARWSSGSARHFRPHLHRRFCIGAIDRGEVIFTVAGKDARLRPGALALINPDTIHACNPVGHHARSYFMLYLDASWCARVQHDLFGSDHFLPMRHSLFQHERMHRHYRQLMQQLLAGQAEEAAISRFARQLFLRTCAADEPAPVPHLRIQELKKELSADLRHPLPLETLANRHGINPYTLLRQFKRATGTTPHAFRLNRQISRARELLRGGLDPATVADECGFYDQSHLHRHFKALTAATPGEYKENF